MTTAVSETVFPDHVPPELRWDHSLKEFAEEGDDPFIAVSRLHEGPDIFYARDAALGRSGWIITRHELQNEAFVDYERFSSEGSGGLDELLGVEWRQVPIDYDPPEQTAFRKVINPFFTPKAMMAMEGPVREACDMLISKFADHAGCEFVEEFSFPFPAYIFLSLVGLPFDKVDQFIDWEYRLLRMGPIEDRIAAGKAIEHYLEGFIAEQRRKPTTAFVKGILESDMSPNEVMGLLYTLFLAGLDTVHNTLAWIMRHLAMNQELQQRLRDNPALIHKAVDEFTRAYSVVAIHRKVASDCTFHGVEMRKGDIVLLPLYLAGRDPKAWENPHDIDLNRNPSALTYASGPHICAGRHLARRELRIALESILTRFDNIRLAPGEDYVFHANVTLGIDRLPLIWS